LKISSIRLENIRSHGKTSMNFDDGITVISGRTGSGKSSVLMAIQYCLFGAKTGISKSGLMRRNSKKGSICLSFEHEGNGYEVSRGFMKSGSNIIPDQHVSSVKKNGKELLEMSREADINKNIMDILGYPDESKATDLFETTTYTKQDEIRKLIDLGKTDRREYIDSILNLSKYKMVWDNSLEVVRRIKMIIEGLAGEISSEEETKEDIKKVEKRIKEAEEEMNKSSQRLSEKKQVFEEFDRDFRKKDHEIKGMEETARKAEAAQKIVSMKSEEDEGIAKEKEAISLEVKKLKKITGDLDYEACLKDYEEAKSRKDSEERMISELEREYSGALKIEGGKCPLCKQELSAEHKGRIREEFEKKKRLSREAIDNLEKALKGKSEDLERAKKQKEVSERIREISSKLESFEKRLEENMKIINENEAAARSFDRSHFERMKKEYDEMIEGRVKLGSEISSLSKSLEMLGEQLENSKKDHEALKSRMEKMVEKRKRLVQMERLLDFFSKAREDIRKIGDVVRARFVRDFRKEFQSRFEEIRRWEQEYSVDIREDYEPFAYTIGGEEVPVVDLSGGEKTSVALAYRLALSDIASRLGGVSKSQTIILDEPTTGFDREDIKVLPEVLRNIKNIPQIIIVTHEEVLKEAADQEYVVEKVHGISKVQ
jgi:exonuclease SbcC